MQKENQNQGNVQSAITPAAVVAVKIFYAKGIRISMKNKTFKEAMHLIWDNHTFKDYEPMKMVFTSTGKVLFMDKLAFSSYLDGNISMQELIELTECDELYRNKKDFIHDGGLIVDAGHLWKASGQIVTLIDDDEDLREILDLTVFEIVE